MTEQNNGEAETRKSLAEGHGITFPNAEEAIKWLTGSELVEPKGDKTMTEQELIEQIDLLLFREVDYYSPLTAKYWTKNMATKILALIKEAGYKSPEEAKKK